MGLDTTHNCWHGSYSAFHRWRAKICEVSGYGDIKDRQGFGGLKPWPADDALCLLLHHSDCDGEIAAKDCGPIADRLEQLMPALRAAGDGGGHIGYYAEKTQQFIDGLRDASAKGEAVEFR